MKKIFTLFIIALIGLSSCEDYLDRKNLDSFDDANFWSSENNMRLFAQGAYTAYFTGYGSGFTWGNFFVGGGWADEYSSSSIWTQNTATSGNGWSFTWVRRHNLMLSRVDDMPGSDEAKNHWKGIARFFRALEYADLARAFGDVPYFDAEVAVTDKDLMYKDRDPLSFVATKILEDFEFAAANVRANDGAQQINRDVVLGFMSRHLLYFGTFLKYHNVDQAVATTLLEKSKWASEQIMNSGKYEIVDDYRGLFTSPSLAGNKEVIFHRQYETAKATHSLLSYNNMGEPQTGTTLKVVETYLAVDGLPIKQSPVYDYASDNGLRLYPDQYANRDPRIAASLVDTVRLSGAHEGYSTTGIACWKFLTVGANLQDNIYFGSNNITDAPIIRYGEILLNYAEAAAELGSFTQADADKTINLLRDRDIVKDGQGDVLPKLPPMVIAGSNVTANGVVINDPDRDPSVSPILWEIRRERAVELLYEGFRRNDLRRWKKYEYLKTVEEGNGPTTLGKGAYIDLTAFDASTRGQIEDAVYFYFPNPNDTDRGFVHNLYTVNMRRDWIPGDSYYERQYLNAVPLDQIKLYKDMGYTLTQNPGWDTVN